MARKSLQLGARGDKELDFLGRIEQEFKAAPIVYATSDRAPPQLFAAQVASDVLPLLGEHLDGIGKVENIALVLHTKGGMLDTPWPFVNLLRAHVKKRLYVVVPEVALSAGTLMALGADKIYMLPHAFLSPVDPTGSWTTEGGKSKSISIEDVMGFVDFVTERVGIRDQAALVEAMKELTKEVNATVLGNIHRTRSLIERLSTNMLELHMHELRDRARIARVVDFLTHSLFTHQHLIPLREARDVIGLEKMVAEPVGGQVTAIKAAHQWILGELEARKPFVPETLLGDKETTVDIRSKRAVLASKAKQHAFLSQYRIAKGDDGQIQVKPIGLAAWNAL